MPRDVYLPPQPKARRFGRVSIGLFDLGLLIVSAGLFCWLAVGVAAAQAAKGCL